jgi:hypothetical protein
VSRGSKQEVVDDGAGMHGYLLCTILVVVASACDHKDMFMEHVSCGEGFLGISLTRILI